MGNMSRSKGARGEREAIQVLKDELGDVLASELRGEREAIQVLKDELGDVLASELRRNLTKTTRRKNSMGNMSTVKDRVWAELSDKPLVAKDIAMRTNSSYSATMEALCALEIAGMAKRKRFSTIHHWTKSTDGVL